ncbi:MAG: family 43 glycosylhydrolase [Dysgonomonas sp.]
MRIISNPLNIDYKFQHSQHNASAFREGADPTAVLFKGIYYLFFSMSGGFWYSDDLIEWKFHENHQIPIHFYAPDVRQVGEYLYFAASRKSKACPFMRSKDPLSDDFEIISAPFIFWDPDIFQDTNGRVYFYYKLSTGSAAGVEMDPKTMKPIGKKACLIQSDPTKVGWERTTGFMPPKRSRNPFNKSELPSPTHVEGIFMTEHDGNYYIQYASPATESLSYGDGVYISKDPLGTFKMQEHNPFSTVPGGFIKGAGHGSTFEDKHGNWWHFSTMCITVNHIFERRIGLFPCGFDKDGLLFCNQYLADYPYKVPDGKFDPMKIRPEWMLLSYKKKASASSSQVGHGPDLGTNEDIKTCWQAQAANKGEWYQLDLGKICDVRAIQVNFADVNVPIKKVPRKLVAGEITLKRYIDLDSNLFTRFILEGSVDGINWNTISDKRNAQTNLGHDLITCEEGIEAQFIRVTSEEMPYGVTMALSGLRVFGNDKSEKPDSPAPHAKRTGPMDATIDWEQVNNAIGYVVSHGISPDKLYSSWTVYDTTHLEIPFLNASCQQYYCRVDAFNGAGITNGTIIQINL